MTPEQIARLHAQHEADLRRWWREMPGTARQYRQCLEMISGQHGSLLWDGQRYVDACWDAHQVRHAFGQRESLPWTLLVAELTASGFAALCGYGGGPPPEHDPLEHWAEIHIGMAGVLWLSKRLTAQPAEARAWYCAECVCGWWTPGEEPPCGRQTTEPLGWSCWEHHRVFER
jgi:hypothetical protein